MDVIQKYYETFSTLELGAIVSHFCEPCMSISPQGVMTAASRAELAKAFSPFLDGLRAKDYGKSEFVEPQVTMLGESTAMIRGLAVRFMKDGREMERVRISYIMHITDEGWKIAVMVFSS